MFPADREAARKYGHLTYAQANAAILQERERADQERARQAQQEATRRQSAYPGFWEQDRSSHGPHVKVLVGPKQTEYNESLYGTDTLAGEGFTFNADDIWTRNHIKKIFIAVSNQDIDKLDRLIDEPVGISTHYSDPKVPLRDVRDALEHALRYAETERLAEIVETISGRMITAKHLNLSVTVAVSSHSHQYG